MHGGEDLDVAARVEAELRRDAPGRDIHGEPAGLLGVVLDEEEEVLHPVGEGVLPGVDPVRVGHHAGLLGLAEDAGEPHGGHGAAGGQQIPQHLPRADAGQLVHIPDEEQVRARRDRLDQLVREQQVQHGRLVDHHQVGVQRPVLVVGGVAPGLELEQPVHGGGLGAGQLGEPLGGAAGRRGEDHLGLLRAGQLHDRADRERLAAAGPAREDGDLLGEREPHGRLLLGGEIGAGT